MIRLAVIISSVCCCYGTKEWVQQRTDNFQYWYTRLRIGGINFPTSVESPIAFPSANDDSCEIIFPLDDLAGDDNFAPMVTSPTCPSNARKKINALSFWVNPSNWKPSLASLVSEATPHTERLPCVYDDIQFPETDDLLVVLPSKNVTIKKITYGHYDITSIRSWYARSAWSRLTQHLVVTGTADASDMIKITGKRCSATTGCVCGTLELYDETCALVQDKCPTDLKCANPFKPVGHCCKICGFYLEVYFDPARFIYEKLRVNVVSWLTDTDVKIEYHISKKSNNSVHIILIPKEGESEQGVFNLVSIIQKQIKTTEQFAVLEVTVESSGSVYDPNTWLQVLRTLLYVLLVAVIAVAGFLTYNAKNARCFKALFQQSLSFVKFENNSQDVQFVSTENEQPKSEDNNSDHVKLAEEESEGSSNSNSDEVFVDLLKENNGSGMPELEEPTNLLDISG